MRYPIARARRGAILPLVVLSLVALLGLVALGVDVGLVVTAKTQAQNAADAAALTGARSIDGSVGSNLTAAQANGQAVAQANSILGNAVQASSVTLTPGYYSYNQTSQTFTPVLSAPTSPDIYNLMQATVTQGSPSAFARIFGISTLNVTATSTATHRPRDIAIVLDYSGSMNNESDLWNNESYLGTANNSPNSTDSNVPLFGHYSAANANLYTTSSDTRVGKCNITQSVLGVPPLVNDFYSNNRGTGAASAFSAAPNSYGTTPGGDNYLKTTQNTGATYATTVSQIVSNTTKDVTFELDGYDAYLANLQNQTNYPSSGARYQGYTQGPSYFGETFFIWPPDPRNGPLTSTQRTLVQQLLHEFVANPVSGSYTGPQQSTWMNNSQLQSVYNNWPWASQTVLAVQLALVPKPSGSGFLAPGQADQIYERILRLHNRPKQDWRARFFLQSDGVTPVTDNTKLWDGSGNWLPPVSGGIVNYKINYAAILQWIKAAPNPFPSQLRAGNILYYDSIPNDVPASCYDWTQSNSSITSGGSNSNERFWKEYIDWILGVYKDPFGTQQQPQSPTCSIGPDFTWGTLQVSGKPTTAPTGFYAPTYMNYTDNPERPRHRCWFGPMTMIQYLSDTGLLPGTAHDISMIAGRLGVHGALLDIQQNHPNDLVSLVLFNRPRVTGEPSEVGAFSQAQIGLSRDYPGMINALYYPPNSGSSDVRPWDPNGSQTPRPHGDYVANTATQYGFMVAYNQFSSNSALRAASTGGNGRKGAQRLVILETDGMANQSLNVGFTNSGANNSYYNISSSDTITTSGSSPSQTAQDAASRICAQATGSSFSPGFATPNKSVVLHCIAFGAVFEPDAAGSEPANAMAFLQALSSIGGTQFPSSITAYSDPNFYKICTGTLSQRQSKLQTAFSKVVDDGISVVMVR